MTRSWPIQSPEPKTSQSAQTRPLALSGAGGQLFRSWYAFPLPRGFITIIDVADLPVVAMYRWTTTYAGHGSTYACVRGKGGPIRLHRLLLQPPDDLVVDHINGGGLDNRRENLRICTVAQNNANSRIRRGTSVYRGVFQDKNGSWRAQISIKNRNKHLGTFAKESDAASAYDAAALDLWGDFARLNFPEDGERAA